MKILIIGSGGREHALAWQAAKHAQVAQVFVAPGNAGTALEDKVENVKIAVTDIDRLLEFAKENAIDLTIVGPEGPLVAGIVNLFEDAGLRIYGPSRDAAQLEGSKSFTKAFLLRHHIPTADYQSFTDTTAAIEYVRQQGAPIVIKADGLAAGKGVVVAQTEDEAISAIKDMLTGNAFGKAGNQVVIEEFLRGEEASFIVMVDGKNILPLASSQDHKARDNNDCGPNTGGMGAYSPAPVITEAVNQQIMEKIIIPTVNGMAAEGNSYKGFLYAGIMITEEGTAKVLEYNCRFGDPETQPVMMRLQTNIVDLCNAAVDEQLDKISVEWDLRPAVGVVLAAKGYPGPYNQGSVITLPSASPPDSKIFHAGTRMCEDKNNLVSNGGRILCATALGNTIVDAIRHAYQCIESVSCNNTHYRTDIGHRAVERQ